MRMRVRRVRARGTSTNPFVQNKSNEWNKWNNHFYEMKGEVGMSYFPLHFIEMIFPLVGIN